MEIYSVVAFFCHVSRSISAFYYFYLCRSRRKLKMTLQLFLPKKAYPFQEDFSCAFRAHP